MKTGHPTISTHALYNVGLKLILKKDNDFLFLVDAGGVYFDLPGGRIDETEHMVPIPEIIDREVKEELGESIKYKLGKPAFSFRRHVVAKDLHIFLIVYEAEYVSGEIKLSHEHCDYQWINPQHFNFEEKTFFNNEEYLAFKNYFKSK